MLLLVIAGGTTTLLARAGGATAAVRVMSVSVEAYEGGHLAGWQQWAAFLAWACMAGVVWWWEGLGQRQCVCRAVVCLFALLGGVAVVDTSIVLQVPRVVGSGGGVVATVQWSGACSCGWGCQWGLVGVMAVIFHIAQCGWQLHKSCACAFSGLERVWPHVAMCLSALARRCFYGWIGAVVVYVGVYDMVAIFGFGYWCGLGVMSLFIVVLCMLLFWYCLRLLLAIVCLPARCCRGAWYGARHLWAAVCGLIVAGHSEAGVCETEGAGSDKQSEPRCHQRRSRGKRGLPKMVTKAFVREQQQCVVVGHKVLEDAVAELVGAVLVLVVSVLGCFLCVVSGVAAAGRCGLACWLPTVFWMGWRLDRVAEAAAGLMKARHVCASEAWSVRSVGNVLWHRTRGSMTFFSKLLVNFVVAVVRCGIMALLSCVLGWVASGLVHTAGLCDRRVLVAIGLFGVCISFLAWVVAAAIHRAAVRCGTVGEKVMTAAVRGESGFNNQGCVQGFRV